jgi:hypothetical protein
MTIFKSLLFLWLLSLVVSFIGLLFNIDIRILCIIGFCYGTYGGYLAGKYEGKYDLKRFDEYFSFACFWPYMLWKGER